MPVSDARHPYLLPSLMRRLLRELPVFYLSVVLTLHRDATFSLALAITSWEWAGRTGQYWLWDLCCLCLRLRAVRSRLRGMEGELDWQNRSWSWSAGCLPLAQSFTPVLKASSQPSASPLLEHLEDDEKTSSADEKENVAPEQYDTPLPVYDEHPAETFTFALEEDDAPTLILEDVDRFSMSKLAEETEEAEEEYRPPCRPRLRQMYSTALARRQESQAVPLSLAVPPAGAQPTSAPTSPAPQYDSFVGQHEAESSTTALSSSHSSLPHLHDYLSPFDDCEVSFDQIQIEIESLDSELGETGHARHYGDYLSPTCTPPRFDPQQYHHYHSQRRLAYAPPSPPSIHLCASVYSTNAASTWLGDPGAHPSGLSWCTEDDDEDDEAALPSWYKSATRAMPTPPLTPKIARFENQLLRLIPPMLMVEGWPVAVWWPNEMNHLSHEELRTEFVARAAMFHHYPEISC